ncbi:MAG: hypothetical protein JSS67_03985 [Bacteroidetes bacterium]|nr:hypothetical protein [Bacteroidota bacterium]
MKLTKYYQLQQEFMSWQRCLEFFKQENALLKYRLSELVDDIEINMNIQTAEYFQNEFLHVDEMLENFTKSLANFSHISDEKKDSPSVVASHQLLRERMHELGKKWLNLSLEFNMKMSPAASSIDDIS